ncbi:hypothetical protein ACXVQ9_07850 [Lactobacillus crispatus]
MVNYILSKSPNGLFLIFERSVQFDFTIRHSNTFNDFQEYYYALSSVINALTALIIKNPKLASQLLTKIEKVSIPKPISYLKIRTNVLKYLLDYRLGKTDEKLISIKLENLKWLGLTDIAKDLTFFFNRIKNDRSPLS